MFFISKRHLKFTYFLLCILAISLCGCGADSPSGQSEGGFSLTSSGTQRSNKPNVLKPVSDGINVVGNEHIVIDCGQTSEGYLTATYLGASAKSKLQLTGPDNITYTYDLNINEPAVIPITAGSGNYDMTLYEGVGANQFSILYAGSETFNITNEFGPFLYPNQYVNFDEHSEAVAMAEQLAIGASCDLEVVSNVYQYIISNITYDHEEASTVESSYLPDVDEVLATKKGICFDYASLMAAMLRSQSIPTKLQIGYASDAYHAWISVYTKEQGWIDGIMEFDGTTWTLMDPTFAANSDKSKMKNLIGSGNNYVTKFTY